MGACICTGPCVLAFCIQVGTILYRIWNSPVGTLLIELVKELQKIENEKNKASQVADSPPDVELETIKVVATDKVVDEQKNGTYPYLKLTKYARHLRFSMF